MDWNKKLKRLLKSELAKKGVTHDELVVLLHAIGVSETKAGIDSKISRGTFSATFLVQCLCAIGCETIPVETPSDFVSEPLEIYRTKKSFNKKLKDK